MALCLVTGGAGFIGSHLVRRLLAGGHRVRVFDDFSTGRIDNLPDTTDLDVRRGSVLDVEALRQAAASVEWVFHLAALPSVTRSLADPLTTHTINATGTLHALRAAADAGVMRFVYAASSSAYGERPEPLRAEDQVPCPQSPYAAAKLAGEHYCAAFHAAYGLETVRLRFFNVFGPRQPADSPYAAVVARFIAEMADGRAPTVHGDGTQSRDFTYVDNVVEALLRAATAPAAADRVYNVGTGSAVTLLELVDAVNEVLGTRLVPQFVAARPADIRHSLADVRRAAAELGYQPAVAFREGLRRTVAAYLAGSVTQRRAG